MSITGDWNYEEDVMPRLPKICIMILFLILNITFSGCLIDTKTPAERAALTIDDAITSINWNSDQWRTEIDKLGTKLETIESNAAQDIKDIAAKSIASGGQEIKCSVDFMRARTKEDLQRIADKLRGKPTTPPLPTFCAVVPTGLDMNHRPNFVEFYGYDFKLRERSSSNPSNYVETKRVRAFLVFDGGEIQLDSWTDIPTHYLMTIKTSQSDTIPICNKENRHIVLRTYDGTELSSIGVSKFSCPKAPPPPSPLHEKSFYYTRYSYGSSAPWGFSENRDFGGTCEQGYHRSRYLISEEDKSGSAGCYFNNWVGDEKNCKVNVRLWTDAFSGLKCSITIWQTGDVQPAQPDPPCPCW